jgi:hypothetical protein
VYVTPEFVFLHVPKTGGSYVRTHVPELVYERQHGRACEIPERFKHLPRYAFVRNPWDWYVSWWLYKRFVGEPVEDSLEEVLTQRIWEARRYREHGFYGFQFAWVVGQEPVKILRFENFHAEVTGLFRAHGYRDPPEEPVNASGRGPYRDYYDDFTRELVGSLERDIIDRFGYRF